MNLKRIIATIAFCVFSSWVYGQDVLVTKSGEEINAKIMEVSIEEVKYQLHQSDHDPLYVNDTVLVMPKASIFMIKYRDGRKEVFSENNTASTTPVYPETYYQPQPSQNLSHKGRADAITHYRTYKGAATGTLITSLVSPLAGLIPAIACSATPPRQENLAYPNDQLFAKASYRNSYQQQARSIKSRRVWRNWGIGFGVNLALILLLNSGS